MLSCLVYGGRRRRMVVLYAIYMLRQYEVGNRITHRSCTSTVRRCASDISEMRNGHFRDAQLTVPRCAINNLPDVSYTFVSHTSENGTATAISACRTVSHSARTTRYSLDTSRSLPLKHQRGARYSPLLNGTRYPPLLRRQRPRYSISYFKKQFKLLS